MAQPLARPDRRSSRLGRAAIFGGLLLAGAAAQVAADGARVYRWVDRDGHVHYGDVASQNSVEVNPRIAPPSDAAPAAAKINADDCERRRKEADSYRNAGKVTETNSLGESRELSEAERAKLVERADNLARVACGEAPKPSSSEK